MTEKAKLKGLRPLSLTNPLTTPLAALLPVTGAGNRIYRAEEATAPAEAQTLLLLNPAAESKSPAVVSAPQIIPVILPLDLSAALSTDKTAAEPQSAVLPGGGGGGVLVSPLLAPLTGLLHALTSNPPDKGGQGPGETSPELYQSLFQPPQPPLSGGSLAEQHRASSSEPLPALTSETGQRPYEVAFQTGPVLSVPLNLNQDDVVNPQDAQVLYYLALNPANLSTLLSSLSVSDVRLRELMSLDLTTLIPDLNNDNRTDLLDVRVLYYALRFEDILRASPSLRETLLGDLTTEDNGLAADGRDAVYIDLLGRVADLFPVVTTSDNAIEVNTGTSYTLTTVDLSARDPDNAGLALSWTVTTAPTRGQLELSGDTGTAILSFTQAQLEAGEVLYVHTGDDNTDDRFEVRLQNPDDPAGTVRSTVPLTVEVSTPPDLPPTGVTLSNVVPPLAEDADVSARTRVADIVVTDADDGPRGLELVGPDAALFELNAAQDMLFLIADAALNFETNPTLEVTVRAVRNRSEATADLSLALTKANEAPITTGDGEFQVVEGASYMLTVEDLTATDVDDGATELTWTFMSGGQPTNGRLELSGTPITPGTAIDSFTQAQLEAGEVVYVHTGADDADDSFVVRVADDQGKQSDPVTVNVDIAGLLGNIDLSELTAEDGFIIQGDARRNYAGNSVSGAGDVNGDGFDDLIVGAGGGDDGGINAGEAYVVFGKASNPRAVDLANLAAGDGFIIQGDADSDQAGNSVSGAGDVNGDGFDDLIVGASAGDDGGTIAGEAYVVFGKASGFGSADSTGRRFIDLESLAAGDGFIIQGDMPGDRAGSVSGAGDVNGDGFADLIVGANQGDDGGTDAGEAYVVFGKEGGFGNDVSIPLSDGSMVVRRVVDLSSLAVGDGFIIQGDAGDDQAGFSVSGAGDVNGDGFADLIVGANRADVNTSDGNTRTDAGEAYVVFGKASGFGSDIGGRQVVELESLAAGDGFIIQGDAVDDRAGISVSGAGDVNGDGFADLIVGASYADDEDGTSTGEAYVVFGKASGFGSDMGGRQVVELESLAAGDGFIIQGDAGDDFAGGSVSGAGDVNGDGFADLIVGARGGDDGGTSAGEAYLVFGKVSGFGSADGNNRQVVDLTGLAPEDGFIIQGDARIDQAGGSVSGAGDVNGDGFADLIVGAAGANVNTRDNAGEAYVLFGGPAGLSTETVAGNDVLSDDDNDGVVIAGPGDDVLNIDSFDDTDLLRFDGGTGTDTLRLNGAGLDLDLSTLRDTRLSSIERIDLSGNGDNFLTLTRLDLLNLSEVRIDGRAELRVDGNAGDRVTVPADDDGWVRGDDQTIEGNTYTVFNNGNARLLVNTALTLGGTLAPTGSATMPTMAEVLQQYATTHTVDIRAFIEDLPPEDEAQQRKRLEDELAMLGPLPAAKAAIELAEPTAVAEPETDLFDLPPLVPDDG